MLQTLRVKVTYIPPILLDVAQIDPLLKHTSFLECSRCATRCGMVGLADCENRHCELQEGKEVHFEGLETLCSNRATQMPACTRLF